MQDNVKFLLSTRPLDDELIQRAADRKIVIHAMTFIETEPVVQEDVIQQVTLASDQQLPVIFTSMNAADAVATMLAGKQPSWKIFCIGTATRNVVEKHFRGSIIQGTASDAVSLADEIIRQNVKAAVFFCGDRRRNELPEKLAVHQVALREIQVYHTHTTEQRIERNYDGILFFSPSAVESFFAVNMIPGDTVLFAIGSTTATSIRQFSHNQIIESDLPGKQHLVEKAIDYLLQSIQRNEPIKK